MAERVATLVQLTDGLVSRLDRAAARRGTSRSSLIRELLDEALSGDERDEVSLRLIEGYRRMPQSDGRDAWGDLDSWSQLAARRNLAALGDEETESW